MYIYKTQCNWILDIRRNMSLCVCWWAEGMACGGLPFSGTGCPIPDVWQYLLVMYWLIFGMLFLFLTISVGYFCPWTLLFKWQTEQVAMDLIFTCYTKANQKGCFRFSNYSPWGIWSLGWTTCLLHDSPIFGSHFKMRVGSAPILKWELVCKFGVRFHINVISFLAWVHGFMHGTSDFFTLW